MSCSTSAAAVWASLAVTFSTAGSRWISGMGGGAGSSSTGGTGAASGTGMGAGSATGASAAGCWTGGGAAGSAASGAAGSMGRPPVSTWSGGRAPAFRLKRRSFLGAKGKEGLGRSGCGGSAGPSSTGMSMAALRRSEAGRLGAGAGAGAGSSWSSSYSYSAQERERMVSTISGMERWKAPTSMRSWSRIRMSPAPMPLNTRRRPSASRPLTTPPQAISRPWVHRP